MALKLGQRYRLPDGRIGTYVGLFDEYFEDWRGFPGVRRWPILQFADEHREVVNVRQMTGVDDVEIEIRLTDG